jgi:hypothetical protein
MVAHLNWNYSGMGELLALCRYLVQIPMFWNWLRMIVIETLCRYVIQSKSKKPILNAWCLSSWVMLDGSYRKCVQNSRVLHNRSQNCLVLLSFFYILFYAKIFTYFYSRYNLLLWSATKIMFTRVMIKWELIGPLHLALQLAFCIAAYELCRLI